MFKFFQKTFPNAMVRYILVISFVLLILSIFAPILFTSFSIVDFSETGQIGDTIQGIMSPFIGIAGIFLTFIAFYIQFVANEKQKKALEYQNKALAVSSFENNLFELISVHQSIVNESKISDENNNIKSGQDLFEYIFKLINKIYYLLPLNLSPKESAVLVYLYCYYGKNLYENKKLSKKYQPHTAINLSHNLMVAGMEWMRICSIEIF